jgi:Ca2+-binding EF-hand superfamily protein
MASVGADGMTPRMAEMQSMLLSLPSDELARLVQTVSPSPSPVSRQLQLGSSVSPTNLTARDPGASMPLELMEHQGTGVHKGGGASEFQHRLRHAASAMYTERQKVDVAGAQKQYLEAAKRNGLKQTLIKVEDPWATSYGKSMTGKDALDEFISEKEQQSNAEMEAHWGAEASKRKVDTGAVDNVEKSLRTKLEVFSGYRNNPLQTLAKIFVDFDANKSGFMSCDEFVTAISLKLNFGDYENELRALFKRYDLDSSGELSNKEFVSALYSKGDTGKKILGKIREVLALRAGGFTTLKGMGRQFRILDKDKSGSLNRAECSRGLNMLCRAYKLNLEKPAADRLFNMFDIDGNGSIAYEEFIRALRGGMNKRRLDLVKMAFESFEKDSWNRVTLKTIGNHYDVSMHPGVLQGKITPTEALYEFMKKWDKDGDYSVTEAEFIDFYEWVSPSIDNDDYFELMIRNSWHISGGSGWMSNTTCRRVLVEHYDNTQEIVEIKNDLGLGKDPEKIKLALIRQGVTNIKNIKLTA